MANLTAHCGLVTLDQKSSVVAVLAEPKHKNETPAGTSDTELDDFESMKSLDDTALESETFPRAFNKAQRQLLQRPRSSLQRTCRPQAKLREWQQGSLRTQQKHRSEDSVDTQMVSVHFAVCVFISMKVMPRFGYAFSRRDDEILKKMCEEYGPKVAIYFAFLNSYATSTGLCACRFTWWLGSWWLGWVVYLRCLGLLGSWRRACGGL